MRKAKIDATRIELKAQLGRRAQNLKALAIDHGATGPGMYLNRNVSLRTPGGKLRAPASSAPGTLSMIDSWWREGLAALDRADGFDPAGAAIALSRRGLPAGTLVLPDHDFRAQLIPASDGDLGGGVSFDGHAFQATLTRPGTDLEIIRTEPIRGSDMLPSLSLGNGVFSATYGQPTEDGSHPENLEPDPGPALRPRGTMIWTPDATGPTWDGIQERTEPRFK